MTNTIEARGANGTVTFDGTFVTIARKKGLDRFQGVGERRIPLASVLTTSWKDPSTFVNGYFGFETGAQSATVESAVLWGAAKAATDQNTVMMTKKQAPAFRELRDAIDHAIAARYQ